MNPESESILTTELTKKIKKAYLFDDQSKVVFKQDDFGTTLKVPADKRKEFDTIVVLEM
jgi:hypothetical protein